MNTLSRSYNQNNDKHYWLMATCIVASLCVHGILLFYIDLSYKRPKEKIDHVENSTFIVNFKTVPLSVLKEKNQTLTKETLMEERTVRKRRIISSKKKSAPRTGATPLTKQYAKAKQHSITKSHSVTRKENSKKASREHSENNSDLVERRLALSAFEKGIKPITNTSIEAESEEKKSEYKTILLQWLTKHKKYPLAARKKHQQGTVIMRFTIDQTGKLLSYTIENPSDYRLLNKAALNILKKANPLPAVPPEIAKGNTAFSYTVPIEFNL